MYEERPVVLEVKTVDEEEGEKRLLCPFLYAGGLKLQRK
jgi:hypothetical protein